MLSENNLTYWLGITLFVIMKKLNEMETEIMATLADAVAADQQLEGEVKALIDAFNAAQAGTLTAEQQAQVDQIAASLTQMNADITAADPSAAPTEPPPAP